MLTFWLIGYLFTCGYELARQKMNLKLYEETNEDLEYLPFETDSFWYHLIGLER